MTFIFAAETGLPAHSTEVVDFRNDTDLMAKWGVIHRREFRWQSTWGEWHLVRSGKHPTADDANAEARRMALADGYRLPRWWELWRIGEAALPGHT